MSITPRPPTPPAKRNPASPWPEELSLLIGEALQFQGISLKQLAHELRGFPGLSPRTLQAMKAGSYNRGTGLPVTALNKLAGSLGYESAWFRQRLISAGMSGTTTESQPLPGSEEFLTELEIAVEQDDLSEGDEVWVISSREFLERRDDTIQETVIDNLKQGVRYRYFYPTEGSFLGNLARESYHAFRNNLGPATGFLDDPPIVGYSLPPESFPYFSPLHTLVHYRFAAPDKPAVSYVYVEPEFNGRRKKRWFRANSDFRDVAALIKRVAYLSDDIESQFKGMTQLTRRYLDFFSCDEGVTRYADLRELIDRADKAPDQLRRAANELTKTMPQEIRILDVGCGDGRTTLETLRPLVRSGRRVIVDLMEPSTLMLDQAADYIAAGVGDDVSINCINEPFESAPLVESYDIVIAVHSLYLFPRQQLHRLLALLRPGGALLAWIGALRDNGINQLGQIVDKVLYPGDRRLFAEDITAAFALYCPSFDAKRHTTIMPGTISPLWDDRGLNENGRIVVEFLSLMDTIGPREEAKICAELIHTDPTQSTALANIFFKYVRPS